jgi:cyanate permease
MIAALFGSLFVKYGKFNMILVSNVITIVGSGLRMVDNMYVISVGTLLIGLGCGAFTVYCPKYCK